MKTFLVCFISVVGILILMFLIIDNSNVIYSDYGFSITVDTIEKVPTAITNAVENVRSHNFEVIGLNIIKQKYICPGYVIRCYGRDKNNFISYDN